MSLHKVLTVASEIAKKATFHAHHDRVNEAVYLYKLSIKFIDHILDGCTRDPTAFPEQSIDIIRRSREGYMNYVRSHTEPLSQEPSPQPSPSPQSPQLSSTQPPPLQEQNQSIPPPSSSAAAAAAVPPPPAPQPKPNVQPPPPPQQQQQPIQPPIPQSLPGQQVRPKTQKLLPQVPSQQLKPKIQQQQQPIPPPPLPRDTTSPAQKQQQYIPPPPSPSLPSAIKKNPPSLPPQPPPTSQQQQQQPPQLPRNPLSVRPPVQKTAVRGMPVGPGGQGRMPTSQNGVTGIHVRSSNRLSMPSISPVQPPGQTPSMSMAMQNRTLGSSPPNAFPVKGRGLSQDDSCTPAKSSFSGSDSGNGSNIVIINSSAGTPGKKEDDGVLFSLIKKAIEEKRANKLNESIETYERLVELLMMENKELKDKVEQQQNQLKSINQSVASPTPAHRSNSGGALTPVAAASSHEGSKSRGHLLKRASSASPSNLMQSTNDLISALEGITNASTIDYVNDKVDFHERLGGGGSGTIIMRATCKGLTFAAKVLPGEMPPEVRDGVLSEIHVMTRLDHQNVAKYLGHDLSKQNKVMLFMEYYTETLAGVLKKRKDQDAWTTPEEVTKWSMQIAKGLQYLHSLSPPLIHRDLKSENVFVLYDSQGRVETLKIGDFDTAKITEKTKATFTRNLGTLGFMAPEVCNPTAKGYNEKADIWSFGMVMYEMIQMDIPFYNVPVLQRYDLQQKGVRPTFDLGDNIEPFNELIELFMKCTEKNPSLRPTAKKIIKSLATIL